MTVRRSATGTRVPLHLIPHTIARQIHKQGKDMSHTSEKKVHLHHYTITVRTKSPNRELRPGHARDLSFSHEPTDHCDHVSRDHDSGGTP